MVRAGWFSRGDAQTVAWLRIDIDIFENPKIARLTEPAKLLYIRGLCEAKRLERGGILPLATVLKIADTDNREWRRFVLELVDGGLWHAGTVANSDDALARFVGDSRKIRDKFAGNSRKIRDKFEGGMPAYFAIHDWDEYQRDAPALDQHRRKNAERQAKLRERRRAEAQQNASQTAMPDVAEANDSNVTVTPTTYTDTVTLRPNVTNVTLEPSNNAREEENNVTDFQNENDEQKPSAIDEQPAPIAAEDQPAPKPKKKRTTAGHTELRPDWMPAAGTEQWAADTWGYDPADYARTLEAFRDWFAMSGRRHKSWDAALKVWLRRQKDGSLRPIAIPAGRAQNGRSYQLTDERLAELANGD